MLVFTLLLTILLMLAGLIAYAGDQLGAMVGKRRLSLFGWRPKRTGQVVGMAAGVMIMLSTVAVLAIAFRGATAVILNAERTARELRGLREQQTRLEAEVARTQQELSQAQTRIGEAEAAKNLARDARDAALRTRERIVAQQEALRAELQALERESARLQETNAELALTNELLSEQNSELSRQNTQFQSTFNDLQTEIVTLRDDLRTLQRTSEQEAQNLRDTLAQFEAASGSELTYRQGEIVYSDVIAAQGSADIAAALATFVADAQQAVIGRGGSGVELSSEQLGSLIGALDASPGSDLVVLNAAANTVGATQVEVNVEARDNLELLKRGQLVASHQIHAGGRGAPVSRTSLRAESARLLQQSVNRLQRIGLFEQVRPAPSEAAFTAFTEALSRLSGAVVIGTVARQDIYVAGPAELDFVILYEVSP